MAPSKRSLLERQVDWAGWLLFWQTLAGWLVWSWSGAMILAVLWFSIQPLLLPALYGESPLWPRLATAAGALGAATAGALLVAWLRAPSKHEAALLLDERFGLRERVTTALMLSPGQRRSPAGQALLADAEQRVAKLDVLSRFGLHLRWTAALVPVCGVLLALVAVFYPGPKTEQAQPSLAFSPANTAEIGEDMRRLRETANQEREARRKRPVEEADARDLEEIEADLEKVTAGPHDTADQLRDQFTRMSDLEDRLAKKARDQGDKQQVQQEQLDRLAKKPKQEGPAKDMQDALARGDFDKAGAEAERLARALQDDRLSPEEKTRLKEQLKDLDDELERLSRLKDEEQQLKDLADKGEIEQETLDREMEDLQKKRGDLKDIDEASKEMDQCKDSLEKGDGEQAGQCMKRVAARMRRMQAQKDDQARLSRELDQLRQTKKSIARGMAQGAGQGAGRRPEAKDGETGSLDTRVSGPTDFKGQKVLTGHGPPGKSFKPKSTEEMARDIQQGNQEAAEALSRQSLPKAASDLARGYYENLGGQKEKNAKKE